MSREEYLNKRKELLDKGKAFIDTGDLEKFESTANEVGELDKQYQDEAKARADMEALTNSAPVPKLENHNVPVTGAPVDTMVIDNGKEKDNYVNAWAKHMMGKQLNDEERGDFEMANAALSTETEGVLVPKTVVAGIFQEVGELYPLYADVFKTNIEGKVTVLKSESSSESKWYDENKETEDGAETFVDATLNGCELSRSITVSWKLKTMSIKEFIPFITSKLAEKMGSAAAYGVFDGKGASTDSKADEPTGIKTALLADKEKEQVVTINDKPTYSNLTKMIALVKGTNKKGSKFYAKSDFIWNVLANITDNTGKPYFIPDPSSDVIGRLFGFIVEEDDSVDTLLFGNAYNGYHLNVNKEVTLDSEDHKKARKTDYIAYAIMDGNIRTKKAFAYLDITVNKPGETAKTPDIPNTTPVKPEPAK